MARSDDSPRGAIELPQRRGLARVFPLAHHLRGYRSSDLARDLLAALLVTVLLVPQAMAYALLADLPPQVGLYAAVLPAALYGFFGTSRYLAVGPVALVSLLTAEALATVSGGARTDLDGAAVDPVLAAVTLAALVGVVLLVLGLVRGGFLIRFISEPVLTGFAAAAALLIAFSQLPNLLGLDVERHSSFVDRLLELLPRLLEADLVTLALGAGAFLFLVAAARFGKRLLARLGVRGGARLLLANAAPLLAVVAGTFLVVTLHLDVAVVGPIPGGAPGGLPPLTLPAMLPDLWLALLPSALAIGFVSFVTSVAIARRLAAANGENGANGGRVEPNRELIALGAAGIGASLTGGYPVGGSISRSVLAADVGARSPLAAVATGAFVLVAALAAAPLLASLPKGVLAAVIMTAVVGLIDVAALRRTWRSSPEDGLALVLTFAAVLLFGVAEGIGIGALAGIVIYLWRTSRPRVVVEGRVEGKEEFRSVERSDVEEEASPVVVVRVDQDLYFANAEHFENEVLARLAAREGVCCMVLDLRGVNELDASALDALHRLADALEEAGIDLCLSEVKRQVGERLELDGLLGALGEERVFVSTPEAVDTMERRYEE
jgi:sulfate permease, SulP family